MPACPAKPFSCLNQFSHDAWQELRGTPFRDDAFTEKDWQRHLTWRRYIPELEVSSLVALTLAPVWLWSVFVSMCLGLYATYAEPKGWPNVSSHDALIAPFTLTSFALSLLMLFKTNSSYSRWWEARTLWGSAYITVRSIMRLAISFVGRDNPHLVPPLYRWTAALLPALAAYLRQRDHYLTDHLGGLLLPEELQYLQLRLEGGIPPIAALQVLSRLLDLAQQLHSMERQQLEALLSHCDVIVGGCERILKQPVPYAYNRHTHRFILCYITFLPFAFWPLFGWVTLPIMAVFTFLIAGAENVGVQIEEPHRVLPLNQICGGALRALCLMMADQSSSADMAAFASSAAASSAAASSAQGPANGAVQDPTAPPKEVLVQVGRPQRLPPLKLAPMPLADVPLLPLASGERPRHGRAAAAAAAAGAAGVERSLPSAVSTPATARPVSPEVLESLAAGAGPQ